MDAGDATSTRENARLIEQLAAALPSGMVDRSAEACALAAQDIFTELPPVAAVLRPRNRAELARGVSMATALGAAIYPRGGGMSYTSGYLPREGGLAVSVDMSALNRVLEINADDMYVLVEAGCSWRDLDLALAGRGLTTPFRGPLSGLQATVGGAMSQNGAFWGSGRHGAAADSVLGLEVLLADGSFLRTGSYGREGGSPFFRHYGPDLTGLFLGDCGAFGLKTTVSLRLMERPVSEAVATFGFSDAGQLLDAMSAIARADLVAEQFAFDTALKAERMERPGLLEDMQELWRLMRNSGSFGRGFLNGIRTAFAGRGFLDKVEFPLHVTLEGRSDASVAADLAAIRDIAAARGAIEVEPTIPRVLKATPFPALKGIVGPRGERWVPVHAIVPHGSAKAAYDASQSIFADLADDFARHGIRTGCLFAGVGSNGFLLELMFFWPDELLDLHRATLAESHKARLASFPRNDEARALVIEARTRLVAAFAALGACHFQVGKYYPYLEGLSPEARALVTHLKAGVDPDRRMNPGVLGL